MILVAKHDICTYIVANLINGKVEFFAWFKTWFMNLFRFVFGKLKLFGNLNIFVFSCIILCLRSREFLFSALVFNFLYLKLSSHTTTNMVYQLKQLDLRLFWKRHSMVQLRFDNFRCDNMYLKGYVVFSIY